MIDIHSHLLPGLDDGARSWEETIEMARIAWRDGVRVMAATPHMMWDGRYANRTPAVLERAAEAAERLKKAGVPLDLVPGGEIYLTLESAAALEAGDFLTYGNRGNYALVELPSTEVPPYAEQVFFDCQLLGIRLVLAHPERNPSVMSDLDRVVSWIERGLLLQVNARSLLGESGPHVRRAAELLLERRLVHFVASDAHSTSRRVPGLSEARGRIEALAGKAMADALVHENPRRLLQGEDIEVWEPAPPKTRGLWQRLLGRAGRA